MNPSRIGMFSLAVVLTLTVVLIGAQSDHQELHSRFMNGLQKGESIVLKDLGAAYEITRIPNGNAPLGHKVLEIEQDFIVLQDIAGVRNMRIPVYSIKTIVTLNNK